MRTGGGRRHLSVWALVVLAVVAVGALMPVGASALDSDLKHAYAFKVKASNGYSIVALAASERADGRGDLVLFVGKGRSESVVYAASAQLTATTIDADLGALGEVALEVVPSGRKRTLHRSCDGEPQAERFEPVSYRGSFEFHGEEGYADVSASAPREYTRFFFDLICGGSLSGEGLGARLPGPRLRLHAHRGSFHLALQANKNRPGARTRFEIETREERHGIDISRSRQLWVGSAAFDYDPLLRTATLAPPAPFAGQASFDRDAGSRNGWTGNLTVDMPGRSDLPLSGAGVRATLVHACWEEEGDHSPCRAIQR
jgi:hypothetical protein